MSAPDPTASYRNLSVTPVSAQTSTIAGILVTVYGLTELSEKCTRVSCLWLLHPRLQTQACMVPLAATVIGAWNNRPSSQAAPADSSLGVIAVSFDQRNHGTRMATPLANEAWRDGNPTHASDMFSGFTGTVRDTAHLIEYLPGYIFPAPSTRQIVSHSALGISLGGHCAWHVLLHVPAITSAVCVIGCPDYARLMADRARKSKRPSFTTSSPPGASFLGSADFPSSLVSAVLANDPRGLLVGRLELPHRAEADIETSSAEQNRSHKILREKLSGKRLQCLSGGADKLVPYVAAAPFMKWFKNAVSNYGWAADTHFELEDLIFDGVGHDMSPTMVKEATRFILKGLEPEAGKLHDGRSRI